MSKLFYKNMPSEEKIPAVLTCHKHEQLLIVPPTSSTGRLFNNTTSHSQRPEVLPMQLLSYFHRRNDRFTS